MKKSTKLIDFDLHFQDILDALNSNIAILDKDGRIVAINKSWRAFGIENGLTLPNSALGENYLEVCDSAVGMVSESALKVADAIRQIHNNEISEAFFEYPGHSPKTQRWFQVSISKFMLGKEYVIVIHDDITNRKIAEESLRDSEFKFRSLIEQSPFGITLLDTNGRIIEWNKAQERNTGFSRESVLGKFIWDVQTEVRPGKTSPEFRKIMKKMISGLLETGSSYWTNRETEVEIKKPDGTVSTIQSAIFPIKHDHGFMACSISRDITELKKAKADQLLSESQYRKYIRYSPVVALIVDVTGNFVDVNPEACNRLGYSEPEFLKLNMRDLVPPGEENFSDKLFSRLRKDGQVSAEIKLKKRDGQILFFTSSAVLLPDEKLMILCNDISKLKETQTKLQESESFLNNILDNIPMLITVKDAVNLTFLKVNQPMEKFLKQTNQELIGKTVFDVFSQDEAEFYTQQDKLVLKEKNIIDIPQETLTTKDNVKQILQERKVPMFDEEGKPRYILSIAGDITEKVNLEAESTAYLARLEAISLLSTKLQTIFTLEELYPTLLDILLQVIKASMGSIWLFNDAKKELIPVYHSGGGKDNEILVGGPLRPGSGIPGMVYLSQKPYVSPNYELDPNFSEHKRGLLENEIGGVSLPLRTTERIIGVITICVSADREITEEEVKLLTTLSEIAGNAIQNISLREQTEQRLTRISTISVIDRAITSSLDLQVSLEIIISNVVSQLNVDAADILLYNPHSQLLEYSTGQGFRTDIPQKTTLRLGESYAGKAALSHDMVVIKDLRESENALFRSFMEDEKFLTYLGVPLIAKGQVKGVLEVFKRSVFDIDEDWISFLQSMAEQASIAIDNTQMFENLQRSNIELSLAYNATIEGWSKALDLRDKETEGHTLRVTELTEKLARAYKFTDIQLKYVRWGALLHDIGKLGVPDGILLKPGSLTAEEWEIMRMHPTYAYEMLSPISYLNQAMEIPYCHHEKWDGTGYPRGLSGEQIPLAARIFALIDIWDALRSDRPYRKAWPEDKIINHIRSLSGTHLDPQVVDFGFKTGLFGDVQQKVIKPD